MKKLMIAAAIVCAAAAVHAAAFQWSTSKEIFMPSTWANKSVGADQASKTSGSNYKIGKWIAGGMAFTYAMVIDGNKSSGDLTLAGNVADVAANNDGFVIPTDDTKKMIDYSIVITGTYTDSDKNVWTATSSAITGTKELNKLSTATLSTDAPASWTITKTTPEPEPTPEPTSAMLMLLGVAGLALKRKQK